MKWFLVFTVLSGASGPGPCTAFGGDNVCLSHMPGILSSADIMIEMPSLEVCSQIASLNASRKGECWAKRETP